MDLDQIIEFCSEVYEDKEDVLACNEDLADFFDVINSEDFLGDDVEDSNDNNDINTINIEN